jgi:hypothetical protein
MIMNEDDAVEVVRGSGDVFRDLGLPDPDTEPMKSALAAEILKAMREQQLTPRRRGRASPCTARRHLAHL